MQQESRSVQTVHSPSSAAANRHSSSGISQPAVQPLQKTAIEKQHEDDSPVQIHDGDQGEMNRDLKPIQLKPNKTGLPDNLKNGIENLSGFSMDDVKVHYNSSAPAQLQALAYAQGTDIHVAPGQERHLPHEAWHVVQQKQARVNATRQFMGNTAINDDVSLEREADMMGAKALQMKFTEQQCTLNGKPAGNNLQAPLQRKVGFEIEVLGARISTEADDFSDSDEEAKVAAPPRTLVKGEVLHQGAGWKLTPDSGNGAWWTPEYIIAAIDETENPEQIPINTAAVATHAQENLARPNTWSNGANLNVETDDDDGRLLGSFHVTGGVRLSRISQLIKTLNQGDDRSTQVATRAEAISWSGDNYKSVVALVALQISDLVRGPLQANDNSAKRGVGILSRTDLGNAVAKVTKFTKRETFITEVLTAAGVERGARLFRQRLPGSAATGRSIDDQQNLTAVQWLEQLLTGRDFKWSETKNDSGEDFGYDKVGGSTLGHRADGIVLELRSLEEQGEEQGLAPDKWVDVANRYKTLFALLNRKATEENVRQGFGTYQSKYLPPEE